MFREQGLEMSNTLMRSAIKLRQRNIFPSAFCLLPSTITSQQYQLIA
ncbi:MAG: hypothetical protein F6K54_05820 [Okeania sp. SIO3B5]|nr:hypothetical protein [Okeania sp. SIO3B5]NEO52634.1 hypothetical protein [Okeania sp. SIO3B5]